MPNLNPTYGALLLGVLFSAVLFGVTVIQTFVYFQQYASDRAWRKLAVCWLWSLDALHLALSAHLVYFYLVTNYDKPDTLSEIVWSFKVRMVVDALVVSSVHTLYTSRLWTLLAIDDHVEPFGKEARRWSRQKMAVHASATRWIMRRIVPWLVSALVVVGYGIAIAMCFEAFKLSTFAELARAPWATYVPLAASTVIDAVIAGSLCYFLARCRPQFGAMNGPIKTLMVYTLNTGIITSVCSLIAISMVRDPVQCILGLGAHDGRVQMVAYPTTFIPIAIEFLVIKLYINSYMAMYAPLLNARSALHPSQEHHSRHTHAHTYSGRSFLPSGARVRTRSSRYALGEQKHLPLSPSFPSESFPFPSSLSASSLHLSRLPIPANAPTSLTFDAPAPLAAPRLSHPDVYPQYGAVETAVGVALPTLSLSFGLAQAHGQAHAHAGRFHSFTSASSSATAASPASGSGSGSGLSAPLLPISPLAAAAAAVYATPVDPLSPVRPPGQHPLEEVEEGNMVIVEIPAGADANANTHDNANAIEEGSETPPPDYPSPPDRALSPLRFASYSSSSHPNLAPYPTASPSGSFSAACASPWASSPSVNLALPPRPSRPRLGSAYSTDAADAGAGEVRESGALPALMYGGSERGSVGGGGGGSMGGRRYTRMVSEAREWRRGCAVGQRGVSETLGGEVGGAGGGVEDERGVWVWGGPGGRGSLG
ncbi:hypothetical protein BV20DRAFT_1122026 [Pilatotrama ljubarskyi]|nr:hypothetical protein BV20DRAFT_1122026 [Pilatotrama ljubarskyi]